jgi:phosphoglucosamine mutase
VLRRFADPSAEIICQNYCEKIHRTQGTPRAFTHGNLLNEYLHRIDQLWIKRVGERAAFPNSLSASKVTHRASPSTLSARARFDARYTRSRRGRNLSRAKLFLHLTPAAGRIAARSPGARQPSPMSKQFFGTDGIRGVPGTPPLDDATLFATGRALGDYLHESAPAANVLLGMDTRESGPHIAAVLAAGLTKSGATVSFAGVITTPGIACLVRQNDFQAGVVISASHNPYHDNGVKLFSHAGMKFPDSVEESIEAGIRHHAASPETAGFRSTYASALVPDETLDAEYLTFLRSKTIPGANLKGLKIVLDCANGAAYKLGPELFRSLGANVFPIGNSPDGRNINAHCGSLHLDALQQKVQAEHAQLGVAFDGDADRALFVADTGRIVSGDGILLAGARYLKMFHQLPDNKVVATSMSNLGLERILAKEGITLARTNVGDRYVLEEMLKSGAALGGEQSGHIIFLNDSPAGDGLLTAIKVASLVSFCGRLEHLVAGFEDYPQTIVNVRVKTKPPLETVPEVAHALKEAEAALGENGRIVLRYSGTEPLARVMVEAEHQSDVDRFSQSIAQALRDTIGV